jgi:membrane protein implicated in regulation of membrane protease activity
MPEFLELIGLHWFWAGLAALFLCVELLFGGAAFFLATASAALVPALTAFCFPTVSPMGSCALFAAALAPATVLWGMCRGLRRDTDNCEGATQLNRRASAMLGQTAKIVADFPDGCGRVNVDGMFRPFECAAGYVWGMKFALSMWMGFC